MVQGVGPKARTHALLALLLFSSLTFLVHQGNTVTVQPVSLGTHSVPENSGVVASRVYSDIYWMVPDWGNPPHLYAVDNTGRTVRIFTLAGADNNDWEDIALDEDNNVWIAGIGDNCACASRKWFYKVAEPNPFGSQTTLSWTSYPFVYPDGPRDADAAFAWQGIPYVIDKAWNRANVYRYPELDPSKTVTLELVVVYTGFDWVSGADISRDGRRLALLNDHYDSVQIIERDSSSTDLIDFFNFPSRIWTAEFFMGNANGVGFVNGRYDFVVTSEGGGFWMVPQSSYEQDPDPPGEPGVFSFGVGGDIGDSERRPPDPADCANRTDPTSGADTSCSLNRLNSAGTSFFLALGDFSYGEQNSTSFCNTQRAYLGDSYPYQIVAGNHEADGHHSNGNIFTYTPCLPDGIGSTGTYGVQYYFDYPSASPLARIIMIAPSEPGGSEHYGGVEYEYTGTTCETGNANTQWLCNAIDSARSANISWIIVGTHRPCISTGIKICEDGTDLFNLLISKKVDLVLNGHEHNYQRTHSLAHYSGVCDSVPVNQTNQDCISDYGDDAAYEKGSGTVFVTQGAFGRDQYSLSDSDTERGYFARLKPDTNGWGFVKYTVVNETRLDAVWVEGMGASTFTDSFSILKLGQTRTMTFTATDDAWIQQDLADSNFGTDTIVQTDSSPLQHFLLKFSVTGIGAGQVTATKIRLFSLLGDESSSGGNIYVTDGSTWLEGTVTWTNAPPQSGSLLASIGAVSGGIWVEADVTPSLVGDGVVSYRVSSDSINGIDYHSKENTSGNKPELLITVMVESNARDVAATALAVSRDFAYNGVASNPVVVGVTVMNLGSVSETFTVTARANDNLIGSATVTVDADGWTVVSFDWNPELLPRGVYSLTAQASQVPGETDLSDNDFQDGNFTVRMKGDVNNDCTINIIDLALVGTSFGATSGSPRFDHNADLNNDLVINIIDLSTVGSSFGQNC